MTVRECPQCHVRSEAKLERLSAVYVVSEEPGKTRRVYCPHYQKSVMTPAAFEMSRNINDVFKDAFSCAYCPFRIVEPSGALFTLYGEKDSEVRNMYYVEPASDSKEGLDRRRISIRHWKCPVCHSLIEVSRSDKAEG